MPAGSIAPITVSERLLRYEALEDALADLRLEGLTLSSDARSVLEQFVKGEITEEQLTNMIVRR